MSCSTHYSESPMPTYTFSDDTVYGEVKIEREQKYRKWASSAVNLKRIWPRRASKARAVHAVGVGGGGGLGGGI